MKSNKFFGFLFAALLLSFAFSGCKRNDEDNDTGSAADNSMADTYFNDVGKIADQAGDGSLASYKNAELLSTCATVSNDTSLHRVTVDFGTTNCTCADGRNRRGKIYIDYSGGSYRDSGSTRTVTFDNYFVNDNQILGTKTITNNGQNQAGHTNFTITVNGSVVKANGGGTVTWTSNRNREWVAGESTPAWSDDAYLITGTASGTNAQGGNFTATITTALRVEVSCRQIVSGVIEFVPANLRTRTIDFGSGACDNTITVTVNGHTYTVTIS